MKITMTNIKLGTKLRREDVTIEIMRFCDDNHYFFKDIEEGDYIYEIAKVADPTMDDLKNSLRQKRERECFKIINRGYAWYMRLTEVQLQELNAWYVAWLDVPETLVLPEKPGWIK